MKRWLARFNRLPVRLFLWLWGALVLAHYLGYGVQAVMSPGEPMPPPPGLMALSPADGLPPPGAPPLPPGAQPPTPGGQPPIGQLPSPGASVEPPPSEPGVSWRAALVDYGVRALIFGVAAALAARWVSRPLSRLHASAGALEQQVVSGQSPVPVPEHDGPQEVRDVAAAFNRMSERLVRQFEERSMMMAAVSHDLRTPLTRMRLRLEQPESHARSEALRADLSRMDHLIGQVLASVRAERATAQLVPLDLIAFVQACVDDHADAGRPVRGAFDASQPGHAAVVRADPAGLRRVLDNLIDNAVRHGQSAEVSVQWAAGLGWAVRVDDQGPGIAPDQMARVMQPFARLDRARALDSGGAGLGLYIAQRLAAQQGACLALENRREGGLRAWLRWPVSTSAQHEQAAPPRGVGKLAEPPHF